MRVVIDTRDGLAGDIVAAGLIGLGAPAGKVCGAMEAAGRCLGRVRVTHSAEGGVNRLAIQVPDMPDHLHAGDARAMLLTTLSGSGIPSPWSDMGLRALEALMEAEARVHSSHPAFKGHWQGEPVLHEASDIVIDILGMASGLAALGVDSVEYVGHVNVGSGKVTFSHGVLDVPTPATRMILDSHAIRWARSELGTEAATPTGAALLAGCRARRVEAMPQCEAAALAGGTRPLPPVAFCLAD
jgi:hypothetical protein